MIHTPVRFDRREHVRSQATVGIGIGGAECRRFRHQSSTVRRRRSAVSPRTAAAPFFPGCAKNNSCRRGRARLMCTCRPLPASSSNGLAMNEGDEAVFACRGLDDALQQHRVVAGKHRVVDMVQVDFELAGERTRRSPPPRARFVACTSRRHRRERLRPRTGRRGCRPGYPGERVPCPAPVGAPTLDAGRCRHRAGKTRVRWQRPVAARIFFSGAMSAFEHGARVAKEIRAVLAQLTEHCLAHRFAGHGTGAIEPGPVVWADRDRRRLRRTERPAPSSPRAVSNVARRHRIRTAPCRTSRSRQGGCVCPSGYPACPGSSRSIDSKFAVAALNGTELRQLS